MFFRFLIYGLFMGVADLVPGFSAGTMAITLGIYDKLVQTIGFFFKRLKQWKETFAFLIPLGIGIIVAIILFSSLFQFLLQEYRVLVFSFFAGLLIGTTYHVYTAHFHKSYKDLLTPSSFIVWGIGLLIPICMIVFHFYSSAHTIVLTDFLHWNTKLYLSLFFVGFLGAFAMILPGVSGSLMLVLLGYYDIMINMIQINSIFSYMIPVMIFLMGIGCGLIFGSFIIAKMLKHYAKQTVIFMIGILIGSLFYIMIVEVGSYFVIKFFPIMGSLLTLFLGFFLTYFYGKIKRIY